ncbi:hypothetical protein TFLX_02586 [Thermoflexales bacterium]|nr:hypothetical protein TFLX_02586 [Thermoflexales bacterium]
MRHAAQIIIGESDYSTMTVDSYSFGYPRQCSQCAAISTCTMSLQVAPFYRSGAGLRLMLIGQDPTIRHKTERVKQVLMLDQVNSQLSRWLTTLFGAKRFAALTLYATNLIKCTLGVVPSTAPPGGLKFLRPYFENCRTYLVQEIRRFRPAVVLTLGEPTHKLLTEQLANGQHIPLDMKQAFTGQFFRAKLGDVEFDYSPCLHLQTFRVAETYGDSVKHFKAGLLERVKPQSE